MILQIKPFIGLSVLFLSVFFSCGQTKKTEGLEVIPIEAAYLHPTTLKASDYFRKNVTCLWRLMTMPWLEAIL